MHWRRKKYPMKIAQTTKSFSHDIISDQTKLCLNQNTIWNCNLPCFFEAILSLSFRMILNGDVTPRNGVLPFSEFFWKGSVSGSVPGSLIRDPSCNRTPLSLLRPFRGRTSASSEEAFVVFARGSLSDDLFLSLAIFGFFCWGFSVKSHKSKRQLKKN